MDYLKPNIILKYPLWLGFLCLFAFMHPEQGEAQSNSYELLPAPDVWYNSVDGVRLGVRLRGQQAGTFGEGPHRLNAGIWLGTKFPENPVSYYFSFTEPIPAISEFGSEGNISVESSYRTGFQFHGLSFNKRWQVGFNERNFKELSLGYRAEHRFDDDYLLYPQLWQDQWLHLISLHFLMTDTNAPGRYWLSLTADANVGGKQDEFGRGELSFLQKISLSERFTLSSRLYSALATNETSPEYLFSRSLSSPRNWMDNGFTRARGTIPPAWVESGVIQVTGGPNLRGYLKRDIDILNNGGAPLFSSMTSLNLELEYPNPIDRAINGIPVLGELTELSSYLFYDGGTSIGITQYEESRVLSDAGLGFLFSINVPDYLGKRRGIMLRYDIPLWLSHPGKQNAFEFRSVIGIGAVFNL